MTTPPTPPPVEDLTGSGRELVAGHLARYAVLWADMAERSGLDPARWLASLYADLSAWCPEDHSEEAPVLPPAACLLPDPAGLSDDGLAVVASVALTAHRTWSDAAAAAPSDAADYLAGVGQALVDHLAPALRDRIDRTIDDGIAGILDEDAGDA